MEGFPLTLGSGLQTGGGNLPRALLQASNHGGVTVRIQSSNPTIALVSSSITTPGTPFVDVPVADGQTVARFFVHALEGVEGAATLTASAPRFSNGSATATVVQPGVRIAGLTTSIDTLDPDDPFTVDIGFPNAAGSNLTPQAIRAGGSPVTVTLTSSNPAAAEIVTPSATGPTVTLTFAPGQSQALASLRPLAAGSTTVSASAPGFFTTTAGSANVNVTTPGINMEGFPLTLGSGLQTGGGNLPRALLQASNHGGVTVRIQSSNPALALVSSSSSTPGTPFVDVPVADGQTVARFFVHGLEGVEGDVVITASASGFADGNGTANVIPAALRLSGLATSAFAGGADDPFLVQLGTPNATGSTLATQQAVRAGGTPVTVTLASSNPAAGVLVTPTETGATVTVTVGPGESQAAVSFRPLAAGATTVTAAAPGVIATTAGTVNVTVNP
jgi:hypothetical protein